MMTDTPLKTRKILGSIASLPASAERQIGEIASDNVRTLAITAEVKFHASATLPVVVNIYNNDRDLGVDTIAYANFTLTLSAGNTVRRTVLVGVPETGSVAIKLSNTDTVYAATAGRVAVSVSRWVA